MKDGAEETAAAETEAESESASSVSWAKKDGGYTYTFPERDDSGMAKVDEMYSFSTAMFEDQPDDWYFGKTTRNASTGEVTVVWERSQSTLDVLEEYNAIYFRNKE